MQADCGLPKHSAIPELGHERVDGYHSPGPSLASSDNQITFTRGATYRIAFANWNRVRFNRNGLKGISGWHSLTVAVMA